MLIGKRVAVELFGKELNTEIIGFAQNSKYNHVKGEFPPVLFRPYRQAGDLIDTAFYIRTSLDAKQLLKMLPAPIAKIDPDLPVDDAKTLPEQVVQDVTADRLISIRSDPYFV